MAKQRRRPLILASLSPQRKRILKGLRVPFTIVPSRVSERSLEKNPRRLVLELAKRKALAVSKKYPDAVVLGSDTIVVCRGQIIGKPKNSADSMRILKLLNGRRQSVYTGVALSALGGRLILSEAAESRAFARKLDDEQLKRLAGKHLDKAGSYAVQDKEDPFIARIEGDLDNIIGLPMRSVRRLWKKTLQALALGEAGKTK